jgi:hypothetical protein
VRPPGAAADGGESAGTSQDAGEPDGLLRAKTPAEAVTLALSALA